MSIPPSVAEILSKHVTLKLEGPDVFERLRAAVATRSGGSRISRFHHGHRFASSVLMDPISQRFVEQRFAYEHEVALVSFVLDGVYRTTRGPMNGPKSPRSWTQDAGD